MAQMTADAAPGVTHGAALAAGRLEVTTPGGAEALHALCGFASRRNPKRGFLFVSRVLGRHLPARPSAMRASYRRLAEGLPADLPGPIVFVGMAETAVALGQGVHAEYVARTGRTDALYVHSTRYRIAAPQALRFEESHSHATSHLLYEPVEAPLTAMLDRCATLVIVDDEASTGSTFLNLATAMDGRSPHLRRIVCVTLTDWMDGGRRATLAERMPAPCSFVSLIRGSWRFEPDPAAPAVDMPDVRGNGRSKDALLSTAWGRRGLATPGTIGPRTAERLLAGSDLPRGGRVLVLGTGEFVYAPLLLAEQIEAMGFDTHCQATTRSPILVGHDVACALEFADNYDDGIVNFLYNTRPGQYDRVLICHETPAGSLDPALLAALDARAVCFAGLTPAECAA